MRKIALALLAGFLVSLALCPAAYAQEKAPALVKAINQAHLFIALDKAEKEALATVARLRSAKAGERIITQGETLDRMYIILNSPSEIVVDGKLMATNQGQALVGELEFLDAPPASADVIVTKDADMIELNYAALGDLLDKNPRLGYALMRELARIEAQRLRANNTMKTGGPAGK